ncbi:MAG: hypothetical protein H6Q98_711 [Nitrospirae bacterium]|nr:hypothetical protein [Nitrospirota bacterium]
MERDMTYADAVTGIEKYLTRGKFAKADVFIARYRGLRFIVKDFGKRGFWERNLIGRIVIGRESRAYRALAGIEGLPARFKRLTPFSLAIEYISKAGTWAGSSGMRSAPGSSASSSGSLTISMTAAGCIWTSSGDPTSCW